MTTSTFKVRFLSRASVDWPSASADEDREEKIADLHKSLTSIMLRRLKKDVIQELPTKSEAILRIAMSTMQVRPGSLSIP